MTTENRKVWLDKSGIINVKIEELKSEEDIHALLDETIETLKRFSKEGKVLAIISSNETSFLFESNLRKRLAEKVRNAVENLGFRKIAIIGGGIKVRTVVSFILLASGMKNMKVFEAKEEAIEWLKSP